MATIRSPLASNRPSTSPTRPRRTVSGFSRTRVRCDICQLSLEVVGPLSLTALRLLRLLGLVDAAAEDDRGCPEAGEGQAEQEHHRYDEAEPDRTELDQRAEDVTGPEAKQARRDERQQGQSEADRDRDRRPDVRDRDHHRRDQSEQHGLEPEHDRGERPHCASFGLRTSRLRASPAVMTEPVMSTPPVPSATAFSSASRIASSMASIRWGRTSTRSSPKTSAANSPSSSAGIERSTKLFRVQTTVSMIGSKASRRPYTSLSFMQPRTPMSGWNWNASETVAAVAWAPCGLWAASTMMVGLVRTTSIRPGLVTFSNPAWSSSVVTRPSVCGLAPSRASTAATAVAALCAWYSPCRGMNSSSYSPPRPLIET